MKLTNHHGLPDTFVNVIKRPTYSKGRADMSATELINSPRIVSLKKKHWDDIEQDASEMVWALFGSACHNILEHGKDKHHVVEERLHTVFEGWKLSGAIDLQEVMDDGIIISDYKVTGAWAVMNEKDDWTYQLNIYAWFKDRVSMLADPVNFKPVKALQIIAIIRDWSGRDAKTRDGYPQSPVATIPITLWPYAQREEFVRNRIEIHNEANFAEATGDQLPLCTESEMWEKPTMFALKKEGNIRAKSVHETSDEAEVAKASLKDSKGYFVEKREGERTRCASYCQVSQFCDQYQAYTSQPKSADSQDLK